MPQVITVPVEDITDWQSFHAIFQRLFGFPDFYGRNMDAWVDCMTSLDAPEDGLTSIAVSKGELLTMRVDKPFELRERCPEQYDALIECSAFVNFCRVEVGEPPVLAVMLIGFASRSCPSQKG